MQGFYPFNHLISDWNTFENYPISRYGQEMIEVTQSFTKPQLYKLKLNTYNKVVVQPCAEDGYQIRIHCRNRGSYLHE